MPAGRLRNIQISSNFRRCASPIAPRHAPRVNQTLIKCQPTAGPRSPKLGAPYAYVTTEKFLFQFGFESLRDLPDLEKLEDAGLLGAASRDEPGRAGLALESATGEAPPDRASLLADLADVLGLRAEEDEAEEDAA